jgi:xanthine/uracil permease
MSPDLLVYHGVLLLAISLSFLWLYFTNGRMNAPEAGGFTWWSKYRLIHGMLYLTAAIYAFQKNNLAYIPLLIDVILGFILALLK